MRLHAAVSSRNGGILAELPEEGEVAEDGWSTWGRGRLEHAEARRQDQELEEWGCEREREGGGDPAR